MFDLILQVATQPIDTDDYISPDEIALELHGTTGGAWNVGETEGEEIAASIIARELYAELTDRSFVITEMAKESRLMASYYEMREWIDKLDSLSPQTFMTKGDDIAYWMNHVERALNADTGNYIYYEGVPYTTLQFMRIAQPGRRYYVGAVIDCPVIN